VSEFISRYNRFNEIYIHAMSTNITRPRGRPFVIKPEDVRVYCEALWDVVQESEWPWGELGPANLRPTPANDRDLPSVETITHQITHLLNADAQKKLKARARMRKHRQHRQNNKPVCIHLDNDAWSLLAAESKREKITLSEVIRRRFAVDHSS